MPFIEFPQKILGFKVQKRLGKPNQFGWIKFGWSEFGDSNIFAGVYQQRPHRTKFITLGEKISGKRLNFMMKPAWPVYPNTENQQAVNATFADAVSAWQALTAEQKKSYNQIAIRQVRRGYNYFISKYINGEIS